MDYGDLILDVSKQGHDSRISRKINILRSIQEFRHIQLIHGHFYLSKYLDVFPDAKFITILRKPDKLLFSYYNYLRSRADSNYLIYQAKRCDSFEQFIELDIFQNIITKLLFPFSPEDFYYIGFIENYQAALTYYSQIIGSPIYASQENIGKSSIFEYSPRLNQKIVELNYADFNFYYSALKIFQNKQN